MKVLQRDGQVMEASFDDNDEKLGFKIREARMQKVPYMIIVGEKEKDNRLVSVRQRDAEQDKQEIGEMDRADFIDLLKRS